MILEGKKYLSKEFRKEHTQLVPNKRGSINPFLQPFDDCSSNICRNGTDAFNNRRGLIFRTSSCHFRYFTCRYTATACTNRKLENEQRLTNEIASEYMGPKVGRKYNLFFVYFCVRMAHQVGIHKCQMTIQNLNTVKQTFGFFAMSIAWTLMNVLNSLYQVSAHGKADDSEVVIFWSALFMALAWAIFIIYPISKLDHTKRTFRPITLPFITGAYGGFVYAILVGGLFRSLDLVTLFLPLALLAGFIFGIAYSKLIASSRLINFLNNQPLWKSIFFLSPAFSLFFFLWFLPTLAPSLVFRYMPDAIRGHIIRKTIPKFKVGDDFEPLRRSLPGYLTYMDAGNANITATMENFAFVLQVHCYKIVRLEYGKSGREIDGTVYGKLHDEPCL